MKIEIIENSEFRVVVSAKVFPRKYAKDPNVHLDTSNIVEFLSKNNIAFEKCTKEVVLNNYSKKPKLKGEWVFEKTPPRKERAKLTNFTDESLMSSNLDNNESESKNDKPTKTRRRPRRRRAKDSETEN